MENSIEVKKPKNPKKSASAIRVKSETRKKLVLELSKANKKDFGRRIKPDDLIALGLSLIEPQHIKTLQDKSLSNADRIEREYRAFVQKNGPISKDEFLGKILSGGISNSLSENVTFSEEKTVK